MSRQAGRVCGNRWGFLGPEKSRTSKAGRARWMSAKLLPHWAGSSVFLASAAGWLRAGRSTLCRWPGDWELAGFPCVGGRVIASRWGRPGDCEADGLPSAGCRITASRPVFLESADGIATTRLAVALCAPIKLSRCTRSCYGCDWLACRRSASLHAVASGAQPSGRSNCCGPRWMARARFNVGSSHIPPAEMVAQMLKWGGNGHSDRNM
jgi:hypothetical protein